MKKIYSIVLVCICFLSIATYVQAQQTCGFDKIRNEQILQNPTLMEQYKQFEVHWQQIVEMQNLAVHRKVVEDTDTIYEIPIVVHVMHTGAAVGTSYNRSDSEIQAWIDYTNAVFAGTALGIVGPGAGGARIPIRLVLAKRAPDCTPTTGIVRVNASSISGYAANGVESTLGGARYNAMKTLSRWDPTRYYNIYLVNKIDGEDGFSSTSYIAGYATMPPTVPGPPYYTNALSDDGSVMLSYIAESGETTFAHELGHALSLEHTFEGASSYITCSPTETEGNCASVGDKVCDTEPSRALLGMACPSNATINPCTGVNYNGVQHNIMNYSNCPDRFTPGQAARVVASLKFFRSNLINSNALDTFSTTPIPTPVAPTFVPSGTSEITSLLGVANVKLQEIDYQSLGSYYENNIKYKDNTGASCNAYAGQAELLTTETYTLTVSTQDPSNNQSIRASIDFNNNGSFEVSESILAYNDVAAGTYTATFTIPSTVVKNIPLRMRVKADFHSGSSTVYDLHANPVYGQIEDFTVIVRDEPLSTSPIHLIVNNQDCQNQIQWKVIEGVEYMKYDIERSMDGYQFENITTIYPKASGVEFEFKDANLQTGKYLYRIAVTEIDGAVKYTEVRTVNVQCTSKAVIYPNPTDGQLLINYTSMKAQKANIKVIDVNGRIVQQASADMVKGANTLSIDIKARAAGSYIIRIELENDIIQEMISKF